MLLLIEACAKPHEDSQQLMPQKTEAAWPKAVTDCSPES